MTPASWRVKVCSFCFVLFLIWRAAVAAVTLADELAPAQLAECRLAFLLTESEKVDRGLDALAARAGLPAGHWPRLWAALRDHVPADAYVAMVSQDARHRALTHIVLCAVAFPRRFVLLDSLPAGWQAKLAGYGTQQFVLEYSTPPIPEVAVACDPVASGESFRIWRLRGAGR